MAHMGGFQKKKSTPPKSSILIGFSLINHPFWSTPIFGNTYIVSQHNSYIRSHKNLSPWTKMMRPFFAPWLWAFPSPRSRSSDREKSVGARRPSEEVNLCGFVGMEGKGSPQEWGFPPKKIIRNNGKRWKSNKRSNDFWTSRYSSKRLPTTFN